MTYAYALEKKSEHPLARAILAKAQEDGVKELETEEFAALPGNGLTAVIQGENMAAGNYNFVSTQASVTREIREKAEKLAEQGKTPLYFARNGEMLGLIAVADVIKADSPQAVKELQNMGIHVVMLTGDNERTARAIGAQAGVDEVIAGVLPEGKEQVIRQLKEKGRVAMVGDGINDAPALTRADMGIAIGAGTDVAIDAADVVLMDDDPSKIALAMKISRHTLQIVWQNIVFALAVKAVCLVLGALGIAGMWLAIFADVGVMVLAVLNATRALKIK